MGAKTGIQWTDHTFNPWIGCTKVSAGCAHCYAETLDDNRFSRTLGEGTKEAPVSHWGKGAPRHRTSEAAWREPLKWNRAAEKKGERARVFCASLADVFDAEVPDEWRDELFALIAVTPWLNWQVLTKRPEEALRYLTAPDCGFRIHDAAFQKRDEWFQFLPSELYIRLGRDEEFELPLPNFWLGTSVEDQDAANKRISVLLSIAAVVHFLSCEPLLSSLRLDNYWRDVPTHDNPTGEFDKSDCWETWLDGLDWVICGGESGPGARAMNPDWARSLRDQCHAHDVAFFFKQWGEYAPRIVSPPEMTANGLVFTPKEIVTRVGKKNAGRLLDGRTWDEFPEVEA